MKKLFSIALVAIFAFAMNAKAQNQLIATLNHEGAVKVFYGADAFANAHGAATHGDVITLSPGKFKSTNITKAITIQGAGMITKIDSVSQILPTVLDGDYEINIADSITQHLKMDGIYHEDDVEVIHLKSPQFSKCRFYNIDTGNGTVIYDATFVQCRIAQKVYFHVNTCSAAFFNCVIHSVDKYSGVKNSSCTFHNCYIMTPDAINSEYWSCVIYYPYSPSDLGTLVGSSSSTYLHNLLITNNGYGSLQYNNENETINKNNSALSNLTGGYSDANTYELTEEQKALYKGVDGTEIGIYGGQFPYDPIPNIPQITKFKVASKSTADGKLKVEVEVKGAE